MAPFETLVSFTGIGVSIEVEDAEIAPEFRHGLQRPEGSGMIATHEREHLSAPEDARAFLAHFLIHLGGYFINQGEGFL